MAVSKALNTLDGLIDLLRDPDAAKQHIQSIKDETDKHAERFKELQAAGAELDKARDQFNADQKSTKNALVNQAAANDARSAELAEREKKLADDLAKFAEFEKATSATLADRELAVATKEESLAKWHAKTAEQHGAMAKAVLDRGKELDKRDRSLKEREEKLATGEADYDRRVKKLNSALAE